MTDSTTNHEEQRAAKLAALAALPTEAVKRELMDYEYRDIVGHEGRLRQDELTQELRRRNGA
jgi:hypothetical protein